MALSQVPQSMLDQIPTGTNPVDAIANTGEGGGYWVLDSNGGVYAVGGAPFLGSYFDDRMVAPIHRNDPNRRFTRIIETSTGYALVSNTSEIYRSLPVQAPTPPPDPAPATEGTSLAKNESSKVWLKDQLGKIGLEGLLDSGFGEGGSTGALQRFIDLGGNEAAAQAVLIEMRQTPIYKQKFPAMELRDKNGFTPIDEGSYLEWKEEAKRLMINAGLPPGYYDSDDDFTDLIGNKNISVAELDSRIKEGYTAVMQYPVEVRQEFQRLFGISEGDLAAYVMDPTVGQKVLMEKASQAQIAGAAKMTGFGSLTDAETARLRELGVDFGEAQQGFGLTAERQRVGFYEGGDVSREDQLAAVGDDVAAQIKTQQQGKRRTAAFEGGGGSAGFGQRGTSGVGAA